MSIKVLALDVYGTLLPVVDFKRELRPRKGLYKLLARCKNRGTEVFAASDEFPEKVRLDLDEYGVRKECFSRFIKIWGNPKDFSPILQISNIAPGELFVVGDSDSDILGAKRIGAKYFKVPRYFNKEDNFDLNKIRLRFK